MEGATALTTAEAMAGVTVADTVGDTVGDTAGAIAAWDMAGGTARRAMVQAMAMEDQVSAVQAAALVALAAASAKLCYPR